MQGKVEGERLTTALMFCWIFLFITTYYVLRPVRRGLVLSGLGNENMPFIYMGTALVTGLCVYIYSKFAHLPRKKLIGGIYAIFFAQLLGFRLWLQAANDTGLAAGCFWVWLDVFSIMGVTLFWMYANDIFDTHEARSLFGVIGAGGALGAICGSSITSYLVVPLGNHNMLLLAAGLILATLGIFALLETRGIAARDRHLHRAVLPNQKTMHLEHWAEVFQAIFSSRFLLILAALVCLERITPDLLQYLYNQILTQMAHGATQIARLDAIMETWRGAVEFVVEMVLVSWILKKASTKFSLVSSGVAIAIALVLFLATSNPIAIVGVFHLDEAIRHSWFKAAKELTYTVTSHEILFKVKPVIEMFLYRFARGLAGLAILLVTSVLGLGNQFVAVLTIVAAILWAVSGYMLAREFDNLEQQV